MAGSFGGLGSEPATSQEGVFPWLKSLPIAPEYHPTVAEFQDPISYIFKIEKEASKYGICKVVPPLLTSPRKVAVSNLNKSLVVLKGDETFTTRQQQIGFCPRRPRAPVQRAVWESGESYTFQEFENKAKFFEKSYLRKHSRKGVEKAASLNPLEIETLYWKATADKPFSIEYANDMPGSAFANPRRTGGSSIAETAWNMRGVSKAKGSLLRFMKEEIPGVTSPMVYVAMMFSWFAWHVEDHDFHSLNYLHTGASKTWYGVPWEAAHAFEEVVRVHGYGQEINPLVMFAVLGEKTTVMSPEVIIGAGVPCCRLVQNPGEFVVTFPRAYHSGFSHGFNLGEAANIATPGWLTIAKDAAIRRASINYPPMVSHFQLLYDLALEFFTSTPMSISSNPRSSRLKDKQRGDGERLVKDLFKKNIQKNNTLLHALGKGSSVVLLPKSSVDISICSNLRVGSQHRVISGLLLNGLDSHEIMEPRTYESDPMTGYFTMTRNIRSQFANTSTVSTDECKSRSGNYNYQNDEKPHRRLFSCVKCGILCSDCVAVLKPTEAAAKYLISADCISLSDRLNYGSAVTTDAHGSVDGETRTLSNFCNDSVDYSNVQPIRSIQSREMASKGEIGGNDATALSLLLMNYGNSSDSEECQDEDDESAGVHQIGVTNWSAQDLSGSSPSFTSKCSSLLESDSTKSCWALKQVDTSRMPLQGGNDESSQVHVFCLEHAVEVEQQLSQIGGAHTRLFCHPEYPKMEAEAKMVSEGAGTDGKWNDIQFKEATQEDEILIRVALDSEEAEPVNADWAVKLGINLFYSAKLSWSPLYSKQMPYNSVIYDAFGRASPASSSPKSNSYVRRSGKQKKVVAGKWCGKVWMSNQVHPFLTKCDSDDIDLEPEPERTAPSCASPGDNVERCSQVHKPDLVANKYGKKRKMLGDGRPLKKLKLLSTKFADFYNSDEDQSCKYITIHSGKKSKYVGRRLVYNILESDSEEDAVTDDPDEDGTYQHKRRIHKSIPVNFDSHRLYMRTRHAIGDGLASDDSLDYVHECRAVKRHTKQQFVREEPSSGDSSDESSPSQRLPLKLPRNKEKDCNENSFSDDSRDSVCQNAENTDSDECFSDYSLEKSSYQKLKAFATKKVAKSNSRGDGFSDALVVKGVSKKMRSKIMERKASEDIGSAHRCQQQRKAFLRNTREGFIEAEENVYGGYQTYQRQRVSKSLKAKFFNSDCIPSEFLDEEHPYQRHRNANKLNSKSLTEEGSADMSVTLRRQLINTERGKQAKFVRVQEPDSDHSSENELNQDCCNVLPLKLTVPTSLRRVKKKSSRPTKKVTRRLMKETSQSNQADSRMSQETLARSIKSGSSSLNLDLSKEEDVVFVPTSRRRAVKSGRQPEGKVKDSEKPNRQELKMSVNTKSVANQKSGKLKNEDTGYQCDMDGCTMSFSTKQELALHKRNICPVKGCGKKFFSHKYLVQHRRVHLDDRPLKCPWKGCKMTFKWAWARTEHIRVHTGVRPYVCAEEGCGQTFRFVSDFSRHKRKTGHSGKKTGGHSSKTVKQNC